jgi:hypothetical protein
VAEAVSGLKAQPGRELQVHGSGDLLQTLMAHDFVDEHRLFVYPVVLGSGRRLFDQGAPPRTLKLVDATTTSTGVVVATYARGGPSSQGAPRSRISDAGRVRCRRAGRSARVAAGRASRTSRLAGPATAGR